MRDGDSYAYVCEKFAVALEEIAAGEGPVKMRLHNAYISSLSVLAKMISPKSSEKSSRPSTSPQAGCHPKRRKKG